MSGREYSDGTGDNAAGCTGQGCDNTHETTGKGRGAVGTRRKVRNYRDTDAYEKGGEERKKGNGIPRGRYQKGRWSFGWVVIYPDGDTCCFSKGCSVGIKQRGHDNVVADPLPMFFIRCLIMFDPIRG